MEFRILNTQFIDIHLIDDYKSFIWTDRFNSYGDFELSLAPTQANLDLFKQIDEAEVDYYIVSTETDHAMIIEDMELKSDPEYGNELIVTGRSLESILDRRIIWTQTNINGNLQTGIRTLINNAIISASDRTRRIDNFQFQLSTDEKITSLTLTAQYTGKNLYEVIQEICETNNIGFKVILSDDNKFIFSLYSGTDRSYKQIENPYVIFSPEHDNLINSNYFYSKRELKTITLVAGEGEGSARTTVDVTIEGGAGSGLNRREMYTDARDLSSNNGEIPSSEYLEKLRERGKNYLSENEVIKTFEGNVDTTKHYTFGVHFFMGDIVQVKNEYGIESTSRIVELVRAQSPEGISNYPTFQTIE